jgi:hypothetical protein
MHKVEAENLTRRGAGRPKGSPNKTTAALKDAILMAAEQRGEDGEGKDGLTGYCAFLAKEEPRAFASLLGRVLPMQITGSLEVHAATKEQRDAAVAAFVRADD